MDQLVRVYGLPVLFLGVMLESAGVPVPGETALIAASILASLGLLPLASVIGVATIAAILGDGLGYWIGRTGGRYLIERWRPDAGRVLQVGERFFARHGGKLPRPFRGRAPRRGRFTRRHFADEDFSGVERGGRPRVGHERLSPCILAWHRRGERGRP